MPLVFDPDAQLPAVHVLNPFENASGGSEWRAVELARDIARVAPDVSCWADGDRADPQFCAQHGVRRTDLQRGEFPHGGNLVVVGNYWYPGAWFDAIRPLRVIQVANVVNVEYHARLKQRLSSRGCGAEFVFSSGALRTLYGEPGPVHPSPIDLERFRPRKPLVRPERFVVGRLSRNDLRKHDFMFDPPLYAHLLREGATVRLMGAQCIAHLLPRGEGVELLEPMAVPAHDFLRSLDCFYFRTGSDFDTFARVVFEAMACGLPVVAHRRGGYGEWMRHGENGFLFESQAQALDILAELQRSPLLREKIGLAARATVEAMYAPQEVRGRAAFYCAVRVSDSALAGIIGEPAAGGRP